MSNLTKRTFTGIIIILITVGSIYLGKASFFAYCVLLVFLSTKEFYQLSALGSVKPMQYYGSFVGVLLFVMFFLYCQKIADEKIFLSIIPLMISVVVIEIHRNEKKPFQNIAFTVLGIVYIAVPISIFNFFVFENETGQEYHHKFLLFFFIMVWAYDTFAYIFGRLLGKNHLFGRISPKKTWEGLVGGMLVTIVISYFLSISYQGIDFVHWIVMALIVVTAGTYGDLAESLLKRSMSVKESGNILPGHGGILDRIDGLLFSAPLVFTYLKIYSLK